MADPQAARRVRSEIADVFLYLTRLADVLGVDLLGSAADKLEENERRWLSCPEYPLDSNHIKGQKCTAPQCGYTYCGKCYSGCLSCFIPLVTPLYRVVAHLVADYAH